MNLEEPDQYATPCIACQYDCKQPAGVRIQWCPAMKDEAEGADHAPD